MSTVGFSSQLSATAIPQLKFVDGRAAGLFVEALHLLRRYEETSSKHFLEDAQAALEKSLTISPRELLPKFYLGITKSVLGQEDQKAAIRIFKEFSKSDLFFLRTAAKYNLAAAYVETYNLDRFPEAIDDLEELSKELTKEGIPLGQTGFVRALWECCGDQRVRVEPLYYLAEVTRDYLLIHLKIWEPRWKKKAEKEVREQAKQMHEILTARGAALKKHDKFLGGQRGEIWAWHLNNFGIIHAALAAIARRSNCSDIDAHANDAEEYFDQAHKFDPNFGSSRANLARLYLEVRANYEKAIQLFEEVSLGLEASDLAHFCLGQLHTIAQNREKAIEHFRSLKSPKEWGIDLDDWPAIRRDVAENLIKWNQTDAALLLLGKLLLENQADTELRNRIKALEQRR
ncbi:tetratricopeptide repeat protein [Rhizobium mongolense]|uniref:tetratricopeptide repeat protein n=1 Tax=Rhizobium mongolense TaxID=57676 RepID=UPI0034A3E1A3